MGRRESADALGDLLQHLARLGAREAARLQEHEGGRHLEAVLDPVLDLAEEHRFLLELVLQKALRLLPDADVAQHHGEQAVASRLIENRADRERAPEGGAVPAMAEDLGVVPFAGVQGRVHCVQDLAIRMLAGNRAPASTQNLAIGGARQAQESLVRKDDEMLLPTGRKQEDGHAQGAETRLEGGNRVGLVQVQNLCMRQHRDL